MVILEPNQLKFLAGCDVSRAGLSALAIDEEAGLAAAGTVLGEVVLVRLSDGVVLSRQAAHEDRVGGLVFVEGRLVSGGRDGSLIVWQIEQQSLRRELLVRQYRGITRLAVSPDQEQLLVLLRNERAIRVWNLRRLKEYLDALE